MEMMFEDTIAPIKARLRASGVAQLGVFGSVGRGAPDPLSDVDILVAFKDGTRNYDNFFAVGEALEEVFHRKVDLVTEDSLSPYLGPHILREIQYVDLSR